MQTQKKWRVGEAGAGGGVKDSLRAGCTELWGAKSFSSHAQPVACSSGRSAALKTVEHDGMQAVCTGKYQSHQSSSPSCLLPQQLRTSRKHVCSGQTAERSH